MTYHNSLSALSDPRRRAIFEALRTGPLSVADIAKSQPVSRPAVSQHLKVLVTAGLVTAQPRGTRHFYQIRPEGLTSLRSYIDSFWGGTLDAFKAHIIETEKEIPMQPPVVKTIIVPCPPERAFAVFTDEIALWWPLDKNSCAAMVGETSQALEVTTSKGGEIWETDHEGTRILWGSFTEFDPPHRLCMAWHINRPPEDATQVSVVFKANGTGTQVTLTHSGWEVFGKDAAKMREGYNGGWVHVFEEKFKSACK